jgi:hypothetical protein
MDLTTLKKEELAAEYTRLTNQEPKTAWSKAELIDEINKVNESSNAGNGDGNPNPPTPPATEPEPEKKSQEVKLGEGEFLIVKKDRDGNVIDEQTTNLDIWNNLPQGKLGWERKTPAEILNS